MDINRELVDEVIQLRQEREALRLAVREYVVARDRLRGFDWDRAAEARYNRALERLRKLALAPVDLTDVDEDPPLL